MPALKRTALSPPSLQRRRSGRLLSTSRKSNYFETEDSSEDELASPPKKRSRPTKRQNLHKGSSEGKYQEESEATEVDMDGTETEDDRLKKTGRSINRQSLRKQESEEYVEHANGNTVDDESKDDENEDEDEGEVDEDAPPKVTIIPLEKLRDNGGVEYEDHKLHRNTLLFLQDLKKNNRREWLKCKYPIPSCQLG